MRTLVAIPVYNEQRYVVSVMDRVLEHADNVLVIDDGSTDTTPCLLPHFPVEVIRHRKNHGYGRSMLDAFRWAAMDNYDWVITIDCDEQHEPESIPDFLEAARTDRWDVISGSRYRDEASLKDAPPEDRRRINMTITTELNERFGLGITDAFCGFKAYRVDAVRNLQLDEPGYAFPLQFWVQAVAHGLRITEIPVRLIYNDPSRTFGGPLNDHEIRLAHYREVFERELERCKDRLPSAAGTG
ncbi:MAG: glycosyltransferase family 2 protein [Phycisphaerales bacterium]